MLIIDYINGIKLKLKRTTCDICGREFRHQTMLLFQTSHKVKGRLRRDVSLYTCHECDDKYFEQLDAISAVVGHTEGFWMRPQKRSRRRTK